MRDPSGENAPSAAMCSGSLSGSPPSRPTVNSSEKREYAVRVEAKSTRLPSGVQPMTVSAAGCHVSRFGSPPEAGITKTSTLPSYSPVKAMRLPSGEKDGLVSTPGPAVRRRAAPPSRGTLHRSPP